MLSRIEVDLIQRDAAITHNHGCSLPSPREVDDPAKETMERDRLTALQRYIRGAHRVICAAVWIGQSLVSSIDLFERETHRRGVDGRRRPSVGTAKSFAAVAGPNPGTATIRCLSTSAAVSIP